MKAFGCEPASFAVHPPPRNTAKDGFIFFASVSRGRKNSVLKRNPEYFGVIPFLNQDVSFINLFLSLTN